MQLGGGHAVHRGYPGWHIGHLFDARGAGDGGNRAIEGGELTGLDVDEVE
jgi:hypothetical protein